MQDISIVDPLGDFFQEPVKIAGPPPDRVADLIANSIAENTRRAYASALNHLEGWGGRIPATPVMIAAHLASYCQRSLVSGLARVDRTDLMSNKKAAAIAESLKMRDRLVVMRERLFQLTAATAARTKEVDGLLIDCAGAGRVFGVRIGLPDWNNVLAMPGHQFAYSLDQDSSGRSR
jgi:hypothetical protein